jgi:hypothetical protein
VSAIVAEYAVPAANLPFASIVPVHVTSPVYCDAVVVVIAVTGVTPVAGFVTPVIAAVVTLVMSVAANDADTTPVSAAFAVVAPVTVKESLATPVNVYPAFAVSVIVAVYAVPATNVTGTVLVPVITHATVPVYCAVAVTVFTGVAPFTGAVTPAIANISILVAVALLVTTIGGFAVAEIEATAFPFAS